MKRHVKQHLKKKSGAVWVVQAEVWADQKNPGIGQLIIFLSFGQFQAYSSGPLVEAELTVGRQRGVGDLGIQTWQCGLGNLEKWTWQSTKVYLAKYLNRCYSISISKYVNTTNIKVRD
jgi:hypothetical protein